MTFDFKTATVDTTFPYNGYLFGADSQSAVDPSIYAFTTIAREKISANTTFYVRTDGSDSNDGRTNTAGGAFLTLEGAITALTQKDFNGYTITLKFAAGTYSMAAMSIPHMVGQRGPAGFVIEGDTATPSNCVLSGSSSVSNYGILTAEVGSMFTVKGFKITSAVSNLSGLVAYGGTIYWDYIEWGSLAGGGAHRQSYGPGSQIIWGLAGASGASMSITGGAGRHIYADAQGSIIDYSTATVTLTGTPNFSNGFCIASGQGQITVDSAVTWSGSATGKRFNIDYLAFVNTFGMGGSGSTWFPGSVAGTVDATTFAVYV